MGISVLYVRISSLDGKTDRQRVNEKEFDKVIEDKCSLVIIKLMLLEQKKTFKEFSESDESIALSIFI
jgi:predicted site-specific integrase-resolvase